MYEWDPDLMTGFDDVQMDMYENKETYVVKVKAAGIDKDSFNIEFKGNTLTVTGSAHEENEEEAKDRKYYRKEIRSMSFARTVDLPGPALTDEAKASFKNGVLTVVIPKTEEAKPKKISVISEE
jgi:HSP20 family protein